MKTILIVCTANMCRSPMAEGLLRDTLRRKGQADEFEAASAGVWTSDGQPATEQAVQAMAERGLDIAAHASRSMTQALVAGAALVLTMTRSQAEAIQLEFPAHARKVYLLSEMSGRRYDVPDPVGRPLSVYRATANELAGLIEAGYARIVELASAA